MNSGLALTYPGFQAQLLRSLGACHECYSGESLNGGFQMGAGVSSDEEKKAITTAIKKYKMTRRKGTIPL